jgi:hypothetical protein
MGPAFFLLVGLGAIAAIAMTKKKRDVRVEDEDVTGEDDWGISENNTLADSGTYVGQLGEARWRIYEDPEGYFLFEWRTAEKDGGGSGFPEQDEAGEALWAELQHELGPEVHPETGEPLSEIPEDEPEPEPPDDPTIRKDDWGITTTNHVVDTDLYEGRKALAEWRIYETPAGSFFYVYRSPAGGGGKRDFATQDAAGEALFAELERELGPELREGELRGTPGRRGGLHGARRTPGGEVGP